ncbi:MAG TPA: recombinase RecA [Clostridiales bacterium]|nr:recombinase RecA [Clostridiales bacterium]
MAARKTKTAAGAPEEQIDAKKALDTAVKQINKDFGDGSIMMLGQNTKMQISAIPTGSLTLDMALGVGGLPRGRITEIYGPEASGKTTLALHCVAETQKLGGYAAYIDAEHALDPLYARNLGVNIDELLVSQPDSGEQALEIAEALVRSNAIECLVIDSVAALVPQQEIDGEMGDSHVGAQARLMSQAMRKLSAVISRTNCVVIFINQLREKIGVMYGNPEVTTGGRALKFYATVRIDIRKANVIKEGADTIGNQIKCKVVKNKVAPPFRFAEFDIIYGKGINHMGEVVDIASALEIIDKAGAWYSYEGQRIGQGRDNARRFLEARPELAAEIEAKIRATSEEMKARISEHADAINLDESSETDELPDDDAELRD